MTIKRLEFRFNKVRINFTIRNGICKLKQLFKENWTEDLLRPGNKEYLIFCSIEPLKLAEIALSYRELLRIVTKIKGVDLISFDHGLNSRIESLSNNLESVLLDDDSYDNLIRVSIRDSQEV